MARVLTWFWTRLYDGVELHHFEQLQKVADGNEVVYVPCHRSHIDYLLLSYAIYYKGYAVPHIAAGINLNMPVRRALPSQGRRVLHPPQLQGQRALHDGVHEVPRPDDGARPLDRVLHRRRPQPHRAPAAAEDRHAVDDAAQLPARSAPSRRVPAGVFRLRAAGRRQDLHRRAVRQAEGEGIGVHACCARCRRCASASARCT